MDMTTGPAGAESQTNRLQLCLIGDASLDVDVWKTAEVLGVKAVSSHDEVHWDTANTVFVLDEFIGPVYNQLRTYSYRLKLLGSAALKRLDTYEGLVQVCDHHRPLSLAMWGLMVCVSGVHCQQQRREMAKLIRRMGGRAFVHWNRTKHNVTHMVATQSGGESHQMANAFDIPVLDPSWVHHSWQMCHIPDFTADNPVIVASHKLKPFQGAKVCFVGFSVDEELNMAITLKQNGGIHMHRKALDCSHMVLSDHLDDSVAVEAHSETFVVREEWFWKSLEDEFCVEETKYLVTYHNKNGSCELTHQNKNNEQDKSCNKLIINKESIDDDIIENVTDSQNKEEIEDIIYENISTSSVRNTEKHADEHQWKSNDTGCERPEEDGGLHQQPPAVLTLVVSSRNLSDVMLHPTQEGESLKQQPPNLINYSDTDDTNADGISLLHDEEVSDRSLRKSIESSPPLIKSSKPLYKAETLMRKVMSWIQSNPYPCTTINAKMRSWRVGQLTDLSPRQKSFQGLVVTEDHFVNVLHVIVWLFKAPLYQNNLLEGYEMNLIFGKLDPIYKIHCLLLRDLKHAADHWTDDICIGRIVLNTFQSVDIYKAYQPYFNSCQQANDILDKCEQSKEAFQKISNKAKSVSQKFNLKELRAFPIQRLMQITTGLEAIQKVTLQDNLDYKELQKAMDFIRETLMQINKRKGLVDDHHDAYQTMISLYNDIELCPASVVSADHRFIVRCAVKELGDGLCRQGNHLMFLLFTDTIEIVTVNTSKVKGAKPLIYARKLLLSNILKVIDVKNTEEHCDIFVLRCKDLNDQCYIHCDKKIDKESFLKILCQQLVKTTEGRMEESFLEVTTFETLISESIQNVSL